ARFVETMLQAREQNLCREIFGADSPDFNMMTAFHDAIDSAETDVELQTIAFMVDTLGLTANLAAGLEDGDAARQARKMIASLETKLKQKRLDGAGQKLDWTGWDAVVVDAEGAAEEPTPTNANPPQTGILAQLASVPLWAWVAGASAAMMVMTAGVLT